MAFFGLSVAALALALPLAQSQLSGWQENQINTTICNWKQPRAALLRDTIYLDGGELWWTPGLNNGEFGVAASDGGKLGDILSYNLTRPFDRDTNLTEILTESPLFKSRGGTGSSTGPAGNFEDGGLLANDAQFFLFGGVAPYSVDALNRDNSDDILVYRAYNYNEGRTAPVPSLDDVILDGGVTRNVAYGAAASAPSEQKAWYFSGLKSPSGGPILSAGNDSYKATRPSDRLITVDMASQTAEKWSQEDLGDGIEGRANAEVVWVPVGEQGILVVLGGVVFPQWAGTESVEHSDDPEASEEESPVFMQVIDVYDVASGEWFKQPTVDGPDTRTRGCAVVAHAADRSSFNIYYYGGFDGIRFDEDFNDEVWVLSLPSFTWTKVNDGSVEHARAGHKCFIPYADQMMVFGGYRPLRGGRLACLEAPVVLFNLSSGEWMDSYDPEKFNDYGVPTVVQERIGGDAAGGATLTAPRDGWATDGLGEVFETSYDFDKITTWGPFSAVATPSSSGRPDLPQDDGDENGGGGLPSWVAPVLGVVLGLIFLTGCVVLFVLWRRRKIFRHRNSEAGTEDTGTRILAWMRGQGQQAQPVEKAATVTTDEPPASPEMKEPRTYTSSPEGMLPYNTPSHVEAPDTQVTELADTSPPAELSAAGLSRLDASQRRPGRHPRALSDHSHSSYFGMHSDFSSNVSQSSGLPQTQARGFDSPPLGASPEPPYDRVTSGVSSLTEREAAHLRQISDSSVVTTAGMHHVELPGHTISTPPVATPEETPAEVPGPASQGMVSPPTAEDQPAEDYLSVASSPTRRSAFHENEEDLGKK